MQRNFGQAIQHASPLLMAMSKGLLTGKGAGAYMDQGVLGMHMMQKERQKEAAKKAATEQFNSILGVPRPAAARSTPKGGGSNYRDAIASIESAGSGDYKAVGPETGKGRAYGRYQVMDFNIGPWTEKHLGKRMTPEEFLANPQAQDAVFDAEFGGYVARFGNAQDAASMWFSGRPLSEAGNASDGYTTVPEYVRKFNAASGGAQAPTQDPNSILALMANPDIGPGQRAVLQMLYQQHDPLRQLQIEQMELDLEAARNPEAKPREREKDVNGIWRYVDDGTQVFPDAGGAPTTDIEGESKLRKEFVGLQPVKDFQKQAEAYGRIVASAKDPSPAGDLALIFNYMKVLDPGSVVRESEFATAANAAAVPDRIRNIYNKVLSGERLTPEQRIDFVGRAAGLYEQAEQQHDDVAKQYGITAESYGFERDRTIPDFRYRPQGAPPTSARPQARAGSEAPRKDAFSNATMADLLKADVSAMKDDELDAWERRYHELSK